MGFFHKNGPQDSLLHPQITIASINARFFIGMKNFMRYAKRLSVRIGKKPWDQ